MAHAKGMTAITNPLVNSYKRLVPGHEAPVYIAWSSVNRSPLIRIPAGRGETTRVELRSPDPAAIRILYWQPVWQRDWTVLKENLPYRTA